jgi:flagellar biosynthesis/type III secretory pathway chaperone
MNQKGSWESLQQTLRGERETFHQLSAILLEEHQLLRHMDHHSLSDLAERKEKILGQAKGLEENRTALFLSLLGVDSSSNPMEIMKVLSEQRTPEAQAVREELEAVLEVARTIAAQTRDNASLIHKGLTMVREALRLIYDGAGVTPVYGGSGTLQFPTVNSSMSVRG